MNINIISIGKFKNNPQKQIFEDYLKRIKWRCQLKELEVRGAASDTVLMEKEANLIIKSLPKSSFVVVLDENGKEFSSRKFADLFTNFQNDGIREISFIIGGANGISKIVKNKANLIISLSKMTFPHMVVRSILSEQLYRAFSINQNHPYHRD